MLRVPYKQCGTFAKRYIYHGPPPFARPPNSPEPKYGKILFFLSPFIIATGAAAYAKQNEPFRQHLVNSMLKYALEDYQFEHVNKLVQNALEGPLPTQAGTEITTIQATNMTEQNLKTDVLEIEKDVEQHAAMAIREYHNALDLSKSCNDDVHRVIDGAIENIDPAILAILKHKIALRDTAILKAEKTASDAIKRISIYEEALNKNTTVNNNAEIIRLQKKIENISQHILKTKIDLNRQEDSPVKSRKYWRSVEKARNFFKDEIQTIFPSINLTEKRKNLSQEDFDIFLAQAYSHALVHKKELQQMRTHTANKHNTTDTLKAQIDYELELERHKKFLDSHNQKKIFNIREEAQRKLLEEMRKQTVTDTGSLHKNTENWDQYTWFPPK